MLAQQFTTPVRQPSIIVDDALPLIGKGTHILVNVPHYGATETTYTARVGKIQFIGLSPFYPECNEGVQRAYVIAGDYTDYILVDELVLEADYAGDCTNCGCGLVAEMFCDECGRGLCCCECAPSWLDDDEFDDYRQDTGEDYAYDSWKDNHAERTYSE